MTMVTVQGQTLTERQKGLAACACLMAQGDLERLEPAVKMALAGGVTINELKEAFSQLYAYTGFPRSLNALGVLNKVLENKQANWQDGKPWTRPEIWNDAEKALKQGTEVQTQLSGRPFDYDFCPQDDYYLKSHLFGDIFAGDQLSHADREIVTVAALSGLEGVAPQLAAHKQGAVNMGNSQELVDELCAWLALGESAAQGVAFVVEPCTEFIDEFLRVAHVHGSTFVGGELRVNAFDTTQGCYGYYLAVGRSQLVASEDVAEEVSLQIVVILRTESVVERTA